jgi:hypothetical protein
VPSPEVVSPAARRNGRDPAFSLPETGTIMDRIEAMRAFVDLALPRLRDAFGRLALP